MPLRRAARIVLVAGCVVLALGPAGCSSDAPPTPQVVRTPHHRQSTAPSPGAASPSPFPSPGESSTLPTSHAPAEEALPPSESPTATPARDHLPAADEMPRLADGVTWREAATRSDEGGRPFGTCQKHLMTSIGAMDVAVRKYRSAQPGADDTAGVLVADFPDERTAKRAFAVLRSWRAQCDQRLESYERHDVGELQGVPVGNDAAWYLLSYGPPPGRSSAEEFFGDQGMTRLGREIALVQLRWVGDYQDRPSGKELVAAALRIAATGLG